MIVRGPRTDRERGIAAAFTALLLVPLLAMAGLAVDLGAWYARAAQIQRAVDAAALAGVTALPQGLGNAQARAIDVAKRNGFDNADPGITVSAVDAGARRLRVTIRDDNTPLYFTSMFTQDVYLERSSTAEYILPVPLGSPRNYLGTNTLLSSSSLRENFWLSVSGYCARREHGDRITTVSDANHDPSNGNFVGCQPGVGGVRSNPEHRDSYFYGIEFTQGSGNHTVQIYDAPHCQFEGTPGSVGDSGADDDAAREYDVRIYGPSLIPGDGALLFSDRFSPSDCTSTYRGAWASLHTISNPAANAVYFLEIEPVEPVDKSGNDAAEGQNQMALRVRTGSSFTPCSTVSGEPGYSASCSVNLYGLTHLGVYANASGSNPSFYLADVGPEHGGKVMEVELFDPAEGAQAIELIPPTDDPASESPVSVTWEVACMDGSYRSDNGGACASSTGEVGPPGGYGPFTNTRINVAGTNNSWRPWGGRNSQNGRYSDRLIRLRVTLPADITDAYGGRTWWRIRYIVSGGDDLGDRTTWSVSIKGDPVRLVPNT